MQVWSKNKSLLFERVRTNPIQSWNIISNYFVLMEDQDKTNKRLNDDNLDLFNLDKPPSISYMIIKIGDDESIAHLRVEITLNDKDRIISGDHTVAIWNNHLLIATEKILLYYNL